LLCWCRIQRKPSKFPFLKCTEVVPKYSNKVSRPNLSVPKMSSEKDQKLLAEGKNLGL
jgi:hypothetical protein